MRKHRLFLAGVFAMLTSALAAEDITQEIFFTEEDEDRQTSKLPPAPPSLRTPR